MNDAGNPPAPGASDPRDSERTEFNAWMHRLRNEVNSIQMTTSAALMLLDAGRPEQARANLERAREVCRRCAQMLDESRRNE